LSCPDAMPGENGKCRSARAAVQSRRVSAGDLYTGAGAGARGPESDGEAT
jgi:hypothetical protein